MFQDLICGVIPSQKCHIHISPILTAYGAVDINWRWFEWHKTWLQMHLQYNGTPHISVNMWQSTWMKRSLTDGLVVVVLRIGHRNHQTLVPLDFHVCDCMKKHGIWTQGKQKRGATASNFLWCKLREKSGCSTWPSHHLEFQLPVAV